MPEETRIDTCINVYVVQNFELLWHASWGLRLVLCITCVSPQSHDGHDDVHDDGHGHPLHWGRDHVVVVHHRVRVDKLIAWLHFGLGRLGLLRYLLAKFERWQRPQFGGFVPELLVGLLEALELSAQTALLVVLGVEVDERDEEDHEDDHADAADHGGDQGGGLDLGGGPGQDRGPVLGVRRVTGRGVGHVTLGLVPILTEPEMIICSERGITP